MVTPVTPDTLSLARALSSPTRLDLLAAIGDGEVTVADLVRATGITQAGVSRHLVVLEQVGLVLRCRVGGRHHVVRRGWRTAELHLRV